MNSFFSNLTDTNVAGEIAMAHQRSQERKTAALLTARHERLLESFARDQMSTPVRPKPEFREEVPGSEVKEALNKSTAERLIASLNKVGDFVSDIIYKIVDDFVCSSLMQPRWRELPRRSPPPLPLPTMILARNWPLLLPLPPLLTVAGVPRCLPPRPRLP